MQQKKVRLTKPHTDSGHDYPVGAELQLAAELADWLIRIDSAIEVDDREPMHDGRDHRVRR